jgi:hypothetical protein
MDDVSHFELHTKDEWRDTNWDGGNAQRALAALAAGQAALRFLLARRDHVTPSERFAIGESL